MTLCLDVVGVICEFVEELSVLTVCTGASKSVQDIILNRILPNREIKTLKVSQKIHYPQRILSKISNCAFVLDETGKKTYFIGNVSIIRHIKTKCSRRMIDFVCYKYVLRKVGCELEIMESAIGLYISYSRGIRYLSVYDRVYSTGSATWNFDVRTKTHYVSLNSTAELFYYMNFTLNIINLNRSTKKLIKYVLNSGGMRFKKVRTKPVKNAENISIRHQENGFDVRESKFKFLS